MPYPNENIKIGQLMDHLKGGVTKAEEALKKALDDMNASDDVGPEQLLTVQRQTNIWTTVLSQVTTMGKAVADAAKGIVRNYN